MMEPFLTCTLYWSFQKFDQNKCSVENFLFRATVNRNSTACFVSAIFQRLQGALSGLTEFLATESPLRMAINAFYFTFKVFVLTLWSFIKTVWIERSYWFQNLWNKQLQCTYFPIFQEVKAFRKWNFGPLIEHNMRNIFVENIIHNMWCKNYSQILF